MILKYNSEMPSHSDQPHPVWPASKGRCYSPQPVLLRLNLEEVFLQLERVQPAKAITLVPWRWAC